MHYIFKTKATMEDYNCLMALMQPGGRRTATSPVNAE